jgi:2-polyprenyl-6-methoxyphenol hydroxylase-like FAD-dependent oxidoreductase
LPISFHIGNILGNTTISVGAGFAGLTAAIECHRKGHHVILLEKSTFLNPLGDIISFASNSGRIFQRWEGVEAQLNPINHKSKCIVFRDWHGSYITTQNWEKEISYGKKFNGHRGEFHHIVFNHAKARGIDIRLGENITDYFETDTYAGVAISNADGSTTKLTADCVLAAEGVRSPGRKIVLGYKDSPKPSGYAIYRAWFPSDAIAANPRTSHLVVKGDTHCGWIGPDVHFLTASIKDGKDFSWVLTHKDEADIDESWSFPGKVSDVLKCLEGWDPVALDIVKATPEDKLVDYKLVYRDPLPTFISPKARIALIGDAAHPFLPTSIQGASQAMEDGATPAVCLEKCAASAFDTKRSPDVQLALHAYEKIRYARVTRAQGTGVSTREQWHKADWDKIRANPQSLHLKRESWLLDFDAEAHAYEVYDDVVVGLRLDVKRKIQQDPPAENHGSGSTVTMRGSLQHEVGQLA